MVSRNRIPGFLKAVKDSAGFFKLLPRTEFGHIPGHQDKINTCLGIEVAHRAFKILSTSGSSHMGIGHMGKTKRLRFGDHRPHQ